MTWLFRGGLMRSPPDAGPRWRSSRALENLASGDRMVGVITHVAGLAERVPDRYAVRRDACTSTIVRDNA